MRRSPRLIFIALVQSAIAAFWLVAVAYIWSQMRISAQFGKNAADVLYGWKVALLSCGTFALLCTVAAVGMWKSRRWARWLAVLGSGFPAAMLLMDLPDWLHHPDWDDIACAAVLALWTVFLVLPVAGRAFQGRARRQLEVEER